MENTYKKRVTFNREIRLIDENNNVSISLLKKETNDNLYKNKDRFKKINTNK